eukprot:scaffold2557_cov101-Skeletonema_dohrnii-CCMP3373.AAC.2
MAIIRRVSYISKGLTKISQQNIQEIADKKATHVTLHANQICNLDIKSVIELKHLVDLDFSSNSLHTGYALTNFSVDKSLSLLGCCCRSLLKLNLQANAFTSKSFEAFVTNIPILPHLTTLDISHNNISKLPSEFNQKCPSLRNLSAFSNQIKSLSSLLNWLHHFRGQLERLNLNQKGSSNPVCSATLYREKVIFVLGDTLLQLDSRNVSEDERKQVRARLSIYSSTSCRLAPADQESEKKQGQRISAQTHSVPPKSDEATINDENNPNSSDIEHRVEYLSDLIEKQAHITSGLLEVTQQRSEDKFEMCAVDNDEHDDNVCSDGFQAQVDNAATLNDLRRTAACCTLVKLALEKDKQRQSLLRMTFHQWMSVARFSRKLQSLKSKFTKSENKWRERANDMVGKAVKQEHQKGIVALKEVAERKKLADETVSRLNERIKELEADVHFEQSKSATFVHNSTSEIDRLRKDLQQAHADMKRMDADEKKESRLASIEIESIRSELQHTQQELQKEKGNTARLEMMHEELTKITQEARESSTAHSVELHDLNLEIATKDATIKQLKAAYEQAASRAASDRSKCEHALAGERRKGEMVNTYTKKLRSLESDKQKLVAQRADLETAAAKKESQIASMQQTVYDHAATIANLKAVIEEKDCKIASFDRRLKYTSDERDDFHHHHTELKRAIAQLQSQLDRANDEVRDCKRNSADAHQFETMKLQQTLDALHQSSQLREQELSANLKVLRRECQSKTSKQAKLIKSLGNKLKGCEAREEDLERSHRSELHELRNCQEQELRALNETLANERKSRLDAEKKAAALEASQNQQQSKMKNAIADLAKEFTLS